VKDNKPVDSIAKNPDESNKRNDPVEKEPVKRDESINNAENVINSDTQKDTEKLDAKEKEGEIDQEKILEQLKEQQQRQQQLLQAEKHLINVLENAQQAEKVGNNDDKAKPVDSNAGNLAEAKEAILNKNLNPNQNVAKSKDKDIAILNDPKAPVLQPNNKENLEQRQNLQEKVMPVIDHNLVQGGNENKLNSPQNAEPVDSIQQQLNPVPPRPVANNILHQDGDSKDNKIELNRIFRDVYENRLQENELIQVI